MIYKAIIIGASAGGLSAFTKVLTPLPKEYPLPIIIVQHLSPEGESFLAEHLNKSCHLKAIEALDKMTIETGHIYVAPPGYHILIEHNKTISLSVDPPINYSRPSIDLLFETASDTYKESMICILMTGANDDGAQGMLKAYNAGATCIIQDPKTAESPIMPQAAADLNIDAKILSLEGISDFLLNIAQDN